MKIPVIEGCWAKLERAKLHRDSLDAEMAKVLPEQRIPLFAVKDKDKAAHYVVRASALLPDIQTLARWGAWLGDAIHDLRSPLDHIAVAVVNKHLGHVPEHPDRVHFPIAHSPGEFREDYTVEQLDTALAARFEFYQPYPGTAKPPPGAAGKIFHPMSLLKNLSNRDKHSIITPLVSWSQVFTLNMDALGVGVHIVGITPPGPLQVDAKVMDVRAPNARPNTTNVDVGFATPTITLRGGIGIIDALDGMAALVVAVIREFEPFT
jgi:hypothetical protein